MGYPLLTGELKEKIRGMIAQGMKPGRIIDETGASRSTIYRLAKEIGAPEYEEPEAAPPAPGKIAVRVRRTWETENVSVFEDDGRIEIELTTTENDTVESLRSYGEQLLAIAEEIERGKDH